MIRVMGRRTTIGLDEDVAARLIAEATRSKKSVDEMVNQAVREKFSVSSEEPPRKPFVIRGPFVRSRPGIDFECVAEGPEWK